VPGLAEALNAVFPLSPPEIETGKALLREDTSSGAMDMTAQALGILAEVAQVYYGVPDYFERLRFWARELAAVRPSMAPIGNALGTAILALKQLIGSHPKGQPSPARIVRTIATVQKKLDKAKILAAKQLVELLKPFSCPITLSKSSTVLAAFRAISRKRCSLHVVVAESRPLFEGRETAKTLAALGFSVTLIADAAIAHSSKNADVAVVGADAILQNGSAINKMGSHLLALAAKEQGIPFYVVCETYKWHPAAEIISFPLEEANPRELWTEQLPNIAAQNCYFEEIPAHLITAIITEQGVFSPANMVQMMIQTPPPMLVLQQPFFAQRDSLNGKE
jgi:translation initiation factor eIF-2B subunit delta